MNSSNFHETGYFGINRDPDNKQKKLIRTKQITQELSGSSGDIRSLVQNKRKTLTSIRTRTFKAIAEKESPPIINNIMPIVSSIEILTLAYHRIRPNAGAMTPGTQSQTADEFCNSRVHSLSEQLANGTYNFPDVRRKWTPKPGKGTAKFWKDPKNLIQSGRPYINGGLPDFDAKVVQAAINLILTEIYEPEFDALNVSFGFRPHRGCHDSIKDIPAKTQGMKTAIEGDIKGAFNCLQHDTLIRLLSRRITDKKFLALLLKCCKAGIFDELQNTRTDPLLGVPQGGIVSPTLWNSYMHEFDRFILLDINFTLNAINKRQNRHEGVNKNSAFYKSLIHQKSRHKRKYELYTKIGGTFRTEDNRTVRLPTGPSSLKLLPPIHRERALFHKREVRRYNLLTINTPSKSQRQSKLRYHYVRYADDWIFFTNGKRCLANLIKNKIASFLQVYLGLTLSLEKTKITDLSRTPALFLSFSIKAQKNQKLTYTKTGTLKRVTGQTNVIGIDKDRLRSRLIWKGFLDNKGRPREQPAWSTLHDYEIIHRYNQIIAGTVNYYAPLINFRSTLNYFVYIYEYSCYKTLCQKHRTTIRKLIKKHSHPITLKYKYNNKDKVVSLLTCKHYWPILKATCDRILTNLYSKYEYRDPQALAASDFISNAKAYYRTAFKLNSRCVICGTSQDIQMHHVRHIRGYRTQAKLGFTRILQLLNRKQIPVCKHHHKCIHDGNYDSISLSEFYDSRLGQPESYLLLTTR